MAVVLGSLLVAARGSQLKYGVAGSAEATKLPPGRPWAPIDRVPAAEMTAERWQRDYFNKKRPVIITGADSWSGLHSWTFSRLNAACGQQAADLSNHMLQYGKTLPAAEARKFDQQLRRTANVTLAEVYRLWQEKLTIASFTDRYMGLGPDLDPMWEPAPGSTAAQLLHAHEEKDYSSLADYAVPPSLHAWDARDCPELLADVPEPAYLVNSVWPIFRALLGPEAAKGNGPSSVLEGMTKWLFLAPRGSRAYPAHQHATSNEVLMHMVRGRKHFVMWPPNMHDALYPLVSEARTEVQGSFGRSDVFFMAEGININMTRQPLLSEAEGWEGIAERGDVAYIPCGIVHQIANIDPIFAMVTQLPGHPRCHSLDEATGKFKVVNNDPKVEALFQNAVEEHERQEHEHDQEYERQDSDGDGEEADERNDENEAEL